MMYTFTGPQNDLLDLIFVKYFNVISKKMARNGRKTAICQLQILAISLYNLRNIQKALLTISKFIRVYYWFTLLHFAMDDPLPPLFELSYCDITFKNKKT